jgi:rhodanese-related sulfurtransferase
MNPDKRGNARHWINALEKVFNVAIVLAAIALVGALLKYQFRSHNTPSQSTAIVSGANAPLVHEYPNANPAATLPKSTIIKSGATIDDDAAFVSEQQLHEAINAGQQLIVLDVRERADFARNHFPQAKNIPVDEIEVRAINELSSPADLIVLFCGCKHDEMSKAAKQILVSQGFARTTFLHNGSENCGSCP